MRVNGFKCDDCGNLCDDNVFGGWFFVRYHETNSGYRESHFCSVGCLRAWAIKQWREDDDSVTPSNPEHWRRFDDAKEG